MSSVNQAKSTAKLWEVLFENWYNAKKTAKQTSDANAELPASDIPPEQTHAPMTHSEVLTQDAAKDVARNIIETAINDVQAKIETTEKNAAKKLKVAEIKAAKNFRDAFNLRKEKTTLADTIKELVGRIQPIQESADKIKTNFEETTQKMDDNDANNNIKLKNAEIQYMARDADKYSVEVNKDSLKNTKTRVNEVKTSYDDKYAEFEKQMTEFHSKMKDFGKLIDNFEGVLKGITDEIRKLETEVEPNNYLTMDRMDEIANQLTLYNTRIDEIIKPPNDIVSEAQKFNTDKEEFENKTAEFQKEQDKTIDIMKKLIGRLKALSNPEPQTRSLITYIETTKLDADGNPDLGPGPTPTEKRIQSQHKLNVWITPRASFVIENFMYSYSIMKTEKIAGVDVYFVMETFTISKNPLYINDTYQSISPQIRFLVIYKTANDKYDKWYLMRQDTDISNNKFYSFYSMEVLPNQELNTNVHRKETTDPNNKMKKERDDKNEKILFENIYGISETKRDETYGYFEKILNPIINTQNTTIELSNIGEPENNELPSAVIQINFNEHTLKLVKFAKKYKTMFNTTYVYEKYGNKEKILDDTGEKQMDTGKISDYELLTLVYDEFDKTNGFDDLVKKYNDANKSSP